jgi:hypothetical protein
LAIIGPSLAECNVKISLYLAGLKDLNELNFWATQTLVLGIASENHIAIYCNISTEILQYIAIYYTSNCNKFD